MRLLNTRHSQTLHVILASEQQMDFESKHHNSGSSKNEQIEAARYLKVST